MPIANEVRIPLLRSLPLLLLAVWAVPRGAASPLAAAQLRVEYLESPLAIDVAVPRFAWLLQSAERNQKQSAFQLQVASSEEFEKADVWDSGKVSSPATTQVEYAGKGLASDHIYYWRVRWWDRDGNEGPWSAVATFGTGLLKPSDWKAHWITGGGVLRNTIDLAKPVRRARVFVAATGYYELHLNGKRVGNRVLDPAWTDFSKRILYSTYDVTADLKPGMNTMAALLGRGWYGKLNDSKLRLLLQLQGEFEDGSPFVYTSDADWRALKSPIIADDIYDGETYDARREQPGWDDTWFDDQGIACTVDDLKGVTLSSAAMPAIEVVDTLIPHKMSATAPGVYVYDFGQNFSGWVSLNVQGAAGTRVRMRYSEMANADGSINVRNLRDAKATDTYILRGGGEREHWEPRFTYHGFRYVELSGFPGTPGADSVRGREVHTAVRAVGSFAASKPMLNDIQRLFTWSIKTNLHSIPTDCDQRDERLGWTGDAHLSAETAIFNFDMAAFYTNFLRDIRDAQGSEGEVPNTVPYVNRWGLTRAGDPSWGVVYPLLVRYMYENYGDTRILKEHYAGIKAWADYLHKHAPDGVMDYEYYGDWVGIDPTAPKLTATFSYIQSLEAVALAAKRLGNTADAATYEKLADEARAGFHKRFFDAQGFYQPGSQASQIMALYAGVAPEKQRDEVFTRLLNDLNYFHNVHLTTGTVSTKYLFRVLADHGDVDLAYDVLTQTDYPGFGFMIAHGATTLWELWQEKTDPGMNSHNHHMFASAGTFLYRTVAGIQAAEPGYAKIRIAPHLIHDLNWASASTETPYGEVSSAWKRVDAGYALDVIVPAGTTATIELPKVGLANPQVAESGQVIGVGAGAKPAGILAAHDAGDSVEIEVGSGAYKFEVSQGEAVQ
jgi:alpha-L-rhamnosidase